MKPDADNEKKKVSFVEVAFLAAILSPDDCRKGAGQGPILNAIALLEESAALCRELEPMDLMQKINWLHAQALSCHPGALRLATAYSAPILNPTVPVLTLALHGDLKDTLREFLEEHCNLEGRTFRKSWSNARTVTDNLRKWHIDMANAHNTANAAAIRQREALEGAEARERDCSIDELRSGRTTYLHELWRDGEKDFAEFLSRHAVEVNGKVAGYEIPQGVVERFIEWKRDVRRRKGGMSGIKPVTRAAVFPKGVKTNNPKRRR